MKTHRVIHVPVLRELYDYGSEYESHTVTESGPVELLGRGGYSSGCVVLHVVGTGGFVEVRVRTRNGGGITKVVPV